MDFPLWDSLEDQDYLTLFAYEREHYTEDHFLRNFALGYGRDMLEEDALNEKSCMQVLKIWIDKADEEIIKLEEDILMLKCQLVLDDEDWSKQYSAALREQIDRLDNLIQSVKDDTENNLRLETEEIPPRLHHLLKPLLENYLSKPKQAETSTVQIPLPAAAGVSNKTSKYCTKREENVCTNVLKTYGRKIKSTELEEKEIHHAQDKKNVATTKFKASTPTCRNNEVSQNFISKPTTVEGRGMLNLAHVGSEISPSKGEAAARMVKESSASMSIEKANSREKEDKRKNNNTARSKAKFVPGRLQHQTKVGGMKSKTEASNKVVFGHTTKRDVDSPKPLVEIKGKNRQLPVTAQAVEALEREIKSQHVKKPKMELEHQIQVQPRQEIERQFNRSHAAEVTATPIRLQQTTSQEGLTSCQVKEEKVEYGALNSTALEAVDDVKKVPQISSLRVKDKAKLTCIDLRAIAKSRNLHGYSKLRKEELQKRLGLL